jgi:two-component system sensor histidine kinase YesM
MLALNEELFALNGATLQNRMLSFQKYALTFYSDADKDLRLALAKKSPYTYGETILLREKLAGVYLTDSSIRGIDLTDGGGNVVADYQYDYTNLWYKKLEGQDFPEGFSLLQEYGEPPFAVYHKTLIDYPGSDVLCEINIYFTAEPLETFGALMQSSQTDSVVAVWAADSGQLLYSTKAIEEPMSGFKSAAADMDFDGRLNGEKGFFYTRLIQAGEYGLYAVKFVNTRTLTQSAWALIVNTALLQLFVLGMILVFIFYLYRSIVSPIAAMDRNMEQMKAGIYQYKANSAAYDEIGRLDRKYEEMVANINQFINKDMRNRVEIAQARLKALQAQINPHFLNNMLQSIATQALYAGADDVYTSIGQLARIFQYNMDTTEDIVPLGDEVQHIENYLELQKQRFQGNITYSIHCPQEAGAVLVPKMILQPLVENSIKYGRQRADEVCGVDIAIGLQGGEISLTVADNGVGVSADKILRLRQDFAEYQLHIEHGHGIGLLNVLWRIDIACGSRMQWVIEDNKPGAKLTITWRTDKEGQNESTGN